MASGTVYPTSLDSFTNKVDDVDDILSTETNTQSSAIEELQAKVGIDASVDVTSHEYKINNFILSDPTTTRGDILVRNASALVRLGVGTANQVFKSNGTDPAWVEDLETSTVGLVASTTQTQVAGTTLSTIYNELGTVANDDDAFTLDISAIPGRKIKMKNNGANRAQIFPKSGDAFEGKAANASGQLGDGDWVTIECFVTGTWVVEGRLITREIEGGDWNMDTTASVGINHGITQGKIRSITGILRSDDDATYHVITQFQDGATGGNCQIAFVSSTQVTLTRLTGGIFDNVSYDATSFNRFWLKVNYAF